MGLRQMEITGSYWMILRLPNKGDTILRFTL